jgi:hypothetical protein
MLTRPTLLAELATLSKNITPQEVKQRYGAAIAKFYIQNKELIDSLK